MKKIFAVIITVFYSMFFFASSGLASELYYIQNAQKTTVLPIIQSLVKNSNYTIKSNDPVYGVKGAFDIAAVLQQSDNSLYYYNASNDNQLSKNILSAIKSAGYSYKKIKNDTMALSFAQTVNSLKKSVSSGTKTYNFDDSEIIFNNNTGSTTVKSSGNSTDSLKGYVAQVPAGTSFDVYLQTTINTATASSGDQVVAVLTKNWEYNGHVVAGQGSQLTGTITKASSAGKAYRNGYVKFNFNQLTTVEGKTYNLITEDIEFKVDSTGKAADAAGKVIGRAAVGALAGLIIGALTKDEHLGRTVAIGAGAGAVWGAGSAVMEEGTDAEIPTYSEMTIKLLSPLNVVFSY